MAQAASVQYLGEGRKEPTARITISRNNGKTWEHKELKPGQVYTIPKDTTHLQINNIPYSPSKNYKIKEGNVF